MKNANQKRKLLVLLDILRRETDEEHPLTLLQLQEMLATQGISAERKSLYDDMEELRTAGEDIITRRDKHVTYYLGQRAFDMPELRLLVDAVQSSRFITHRKSTELIRKLEGLCSRHQAGQLQRQVTVSGRVKSMNESIYYNVDSLQNALSENRQVCFCYFDWDMHKKRVYRRDGAAYTVSPWALIWDSENYYLIAYDADRDEMRHYRVDRMDSIGMTEEMRLGKERYDAMDMSAYTRHVFGMFGGETTVVTLRCAAKMANVILDRFGQDTTLIPNGEEFTVTVPVAVSEQFYGWLSGFGSDIRLTAPTAEAEKYRRYLQDVLSGYGGAQ